MYWLILGAAIVLEMSGMVCMKLASGFSRLAPSVLVFVFYDFSLAGLTLALKRIPVSTAYAIGRDWARR